MYNNKKSEKLINKSKLVCKICKTTSKDIEILHYNNFHYLFLVKNIFKNTSILFCHKCCFGESFPSIPKNQMEDFYENDYSHLKGPHAQPLPIPIFIEKLIYRPRPNAQFLLLSKYINLSTVRTILDIGPGGGTSYFAAKQVGINASYYCVEGDKRSKKILKKLDVNLFSSINFLLNEQKFRNYFNIILLSHILEHLDFETLNDLLRKLHILLARNGKLLIEVPNDDFSISKNLYQINHAPHLLFFSNFSLKKILNNCGYEVDFIGNAGTLFSIINSNKDKIVKNKSTKKLFKLKSLIKKILPEKITFFLKYIQYVQIFYLKPFYVAFSLKSKRNYLKDDSFQYGEGRKFTRVVAKKK